MNLSNLFKTLGLDGLDDEKLKRLAASVAAPTPPPPAADTPPVARMSPEENANQVANTDTGQMSAIGNAAKAGVKYIAPPTPPVEARQDTGLDSNGLIRTLGTPDPQVTPTEAPRPEEAPPTIDQLPPAALPERPNLDPTAPSKSPALSSGELSEKLSHVHDPSKDPHHHSALGRLFKGFAKGYQQWDGQGGGIGLLANVLGGGVGSAFSPSIYHGLEQNTEEHKLFRQLGTAQQKEVFDAKQQYQQAQTGTQYAQQANYGNQIDNRNANTAIAAANENQKILTANRPKAVMHNGQWFKQFPDLHEEALTDETGRQRTELKDIPIATKLSDGTPIFTTGDKALDREITQNLNQVHMDFEAKKLNQADLDKYERDVTDWATSETKNQQTHAKLISDGESLQHQSDDFNKQAEQAENFATQEVNPAPLMKQASDLREKAIKAKAEGDSLIKQGNSLKSLPKPTRPAANLDAPKIGGKTATQADIEAYAKQKNITEAAAKKLFEKNGYRVQ